MRTEDLIAVREPAYQSLVVKSGALAVRDAGSIVTTTAGSTTTSETEIANTQSQRVSPLRGVIGDVDITNISPRRMVDLGMDLYVAGVLPWEDYALLAFQPELHPDYDRTIGALTGEKAAPDRPRDFLAQWEERLRFDQKYNQQREEVVARSERIVNVFRQIQSPTHFFA